MPGTSWTSKVSEPGLSMKIARVLSDSSAVELIRRRERIVIAGADPEPLQLAIAEHAGRTVGAVDHQQLVAGRQHAGQRDRHGRRPGREEARSRGAGLQLGQRLRQRPLGPGAVPAVAEPTILGRIAGMHLFDAFEEHRRRPRNGHIDHSAKPFLAPAALNELRVRMDRLLVAHPVEASPRAGEGTG